MALIVAEVRAQPDRDQGGVRAREQVAEALLRRSGRVVRVEDHPADELGVVEGRQPCQVELERQLRERRLEGGGHLLSRGLTSLPLLLLREALLGGPPLGLLGGRLGRLLCAADLFLEDPLDLGDALEQEGGGPEDDPARGQLRDPVTDGGQGLVLAPRQGTAELRAARETGLQLEQHLEVLGQHQLAQVLADEDDRRVVAELLPEALGRPELGRVLVDQRVGAGVRLQPEGGDRPGDRQRQHNANTSHGRRTANPATRSKTLPAFTRRRLGRPHAPHAGHAALTKVGRCQWWYRRRSSRPRRRAARSPPRPRRSGRAGRAGGAPIPLHPGSTDWRR